MSSSTITEKTVTLNSVKCVCPSSGMDEAISTLLAIFLTSMGDKTKLAEISAVVAGSYAAGGTLIRVEGLEQLENTYLFSQDVLDQLDKKYSGSDDLYIKMGGAKVWPSGDSTSIESQETKTIGTSVTFPDFPGETETTTIELWEYDWGSGDDHMGTLTIPDSHPDGTFTYLVTSSSEASAYELALTVSSRKVGPL